MRFGHFSLSRTSAHEQIGFDQARKTLLILGGSQGSLSLNKIILKCVQGLPALAETLNIIHQTGAQDSTNWAKLIMIWASLRLSLIITMILSAYYQAADIIIGRAGAGTIFETLFFSKPCILIPLELKGNDHQLHNAQAITRQHPQLFTVIRQVELTHSTQPLSKL